VEVVWLGHATALIEMDGTRLLTDPVLRNRVGPLVRVAPPVDPEAASGIDAVLLSHLHADHAQPASLRQLPRSALVLAPHGAGSWLRRHGISNVHELQVGDELDVHGIRVSAVTATHGPGRHPLGPSADPIGFVARASQAVYFAGDTDIFGGMAELSALDLALLPVWGWGSKLGPGHLDPERAARAAALISPRVAIPIHWGTFALPGPLGRKAPGDAPARAFVAYAARSAPDVEVRLLRPGESTSVTPAPSR
jgi:L-ascorbate metabolism protein UlaG (beta-lactamase superfamily)